ncbi:MAG: hypothetical protein KGI06_05415 [Candidatus Micrarchaeota archaeon]|nr:hypothetical protein [Candidatus Micrarchaeota archaeon]
MVTVVRDKSYDLKKKALACDDAALVARLEAASKAREKITISLLTLRGKEKSIDGTLLGVNAKTNTVRIRNSEDFDLDLRFTGMGKDIVRITTLEGNVLYENISKPVGLKHMLRSGDTQNDKTPERKARVEGRSEKESCNNIQADSGRTMSWNAFREEELENHGEERKTVHFL